MGKETSITKIIGEREAPVRSYLQQSKKTLTKLRQAVVLDKSPGRTDLPLEVAENSPKCSKSLPSITLISECERDPSSRKAIALRPTS